MFGESESGLLSWVRRVFLRGQSKKKALPSEEIQRYVEERLNRKQAELYVKTPEEITAPVEEASQKPHNTLPNAVFTVPTVAASEKQPTVREDLADDLDFSVDAPLPRSEQSKADAKVRYTVLPEDYQIAAKPEKIASQEKRPSLTSKRPISNLIPVEEKNLSEATIVINRRLNEIRSRELDESFQQMLFREIDSRGMTDVECYQRAHMDRKTFSKIRGNVHYRPKKETAVSLAFALKMTVSEAQELLKKAGYAFSDSNVFDVVVMYYFERRQYNLFEINETLYYYDQPLLGAW